MTGQQLDEMDEQALFEVVRRVRIFARVSPRHKLRIVRALKSQGHVVAMTGDGVNDAPAVKEADIGVAMGQSGTDVTREAAAVVLADDNYATLVAACRKAGASTTTSESLSATSWPATSARSWPCCWPRSAGLPMPLVPIQILWVNLVTDGLPTMALGVDPPEADVMERPPRESSRKASFPGGST